MHVSYRFITKILLIVILVVLIIVILSEIDRLRPRNVRVSRSMYYGTGQWMTAPMNVLIANTVIDDEDLLPFPPMHNFPDHSILKSNHSAIRDEVLNLYQNEGMSKIKGDMFFTKIADDNWKKFYIKWYSDVLPDAHEKLPFTSKLIESIPQIQCAMISVLEPGAVITPHVGPFRGSLRYHLGLQVPSANVNAKFNNPKPAMDLSEYTNGDKNGDEQFESISNLCYILVDGIRYAWQNGEGILFDDTFVHEVRNDTDEMRVILFCDVKRNLCSSFTNTLNRMACKIANVTSRGNK